MPDAYQPTGADISAYTSNHVAHGNHDVSFGNCSVCRENRRADLEADVEFWGGTIVWDEDNDSAWDDHA